MPLTPDEVLKALTTATEQAGITTADELVASFISVAKAAKVAKLTQELAAKQRELQAAQQG
jgi:hypothetical protein